MRSAAPFSFPPAGPLLRPSISLRLRRGKVEVRKPSHEREDDGRWVEFLFSLSRTLLCCFPPGRRYSEHASSSSFPTIYKYIKVDCRALDQHLRTYYDDGSGGERRGGPKPSVAEAFRLFSAVKVRQQGQGEDGRHDELRRVAAAALQSLFSYGTWGLRGSSQSEEGLTIIDDHAAVAEASDRHHASLRDREAAAELIDSSDSSSFPDLSGEATEKGKARSEALSVQTGGILRKVKSCAERQRKERAEAEVRRRASLREAERRRGERAEGRRRLQEYHANRIRDEKVEGQRSKELMLQAREEIARWRADMFERASNQCKDAKVAAVDPEAAKLAKTLAVEQKSPAACKGGEEGGQQQQQQQQQQPTKEERDKLKKAARKKREKEKRKARKAEEKQMKEEEEARLKLQSAKLKSGIVCASCGCGIAARNDAFSRGDSLFCTAKCSRDGDAAARAGSNC